MTERSFTLLELLISMVLMVLVTQFLTLTFLKTGEVASGQIESLELFGNAQRIMDKIHDDLRRMNQRNERDPRIGLLASGSSSTRSSGTPDSPCTLTFISSNYDMRQDENLNKGEGADANAYYDGYTDNPTANFKGSHGMQEVAYYLSRNQQDSSMWNLHRAVRSPIGGAGSILTTNNAFFSTSTFRDNHQIAQNLIFVDFTYTNMQENGSNWNKQIVPSYDTRSSGRSGFPLAVHVKLSFSSGIGSSQIEGELVSANATQLVVKRTSGPFPRAIAGATSDGFILVGEGSGAGVFAYTNIIENSANRQYTFNGAYRITATRTSRGTPVIIGYTFSRSIHIR